jgi:conjugal transfer pilus assembly protein TraE
MKRQAFENNYRSLLVQRNFLAGVTSVLAVSTVVLSTLMFSKQEKIVVVPPVLERPFWIDGSAVSSSYIEQFGMFLSSLLLSKTPASAVSQRNTLLKYTSSKYFGKLKQRLLEEEEKLKKQNASISFFPLGVQVNQSNLELILEGEKVFTVGSQQISKKKEKYKMSFSFESGVLKLSGIENYEEVNM